MKIHPTNPRSAYTRLECLITVAGLLILFVMFMPRNNIKHKSIRINCMNNLKEDGIAFRIWEGDHGEKYPMDVPVAQGGAQELMATGNVAGCFQVMSNELVTPKLLACPGDRHCQFATNFAALNRANLSYFIGLAATNETVPTPTLLSGDDNLVQNKQAVLPGILNLETNTATWTSGRHHGTGEILLSDGSVQTAGEMGSTSTVGTYYATNRVVIP